MGDRDDNSMGPGESFGVIGLALAMVACCALPALLAGGALATLGRFIGSPFVLLAGLAVLTAATGLVLQRRRAGSCAGDPLPLQSEGDDERPPHRSCR